MASCVARHARSRASSGCVDDGTSPLEFVDDACAVAGCVSLLRSVSGSPGAEGAPLDGRGVWRLACCRVVRLLVCVALPLGGAMRRDWGFVSFMCLKLAWVRLRGFRMEFGSVCVGNGGSRCFAYGLDSR